MSKIEKLFIQGVRSFGDKDAEVISFNTPLTLIVGYNGSGKTTVIECLKFATTGELPPNSKGGAFIHEPNLIGEKVVDAQVKLSFRSTVGESFIVRRVVELTVKKASRSQRSKEVSLLSRRNGERFVISTKIADLDALVPEKLGVSPAILDAVIFCHQDESLWPMSEPGALKKRFDEIFEAQRYTKAIDNLKLIRKKHGEELSRLKIEERNERINKEKGQDMERKMTALDAEINAGKEKYKQLAVEKDDLQEQAKEKREEARSFLTIVNDLDNTTTQLKFAERNIKDLRDTIDEMHESDEYLEDALSQYEERLQRIINDQQQKGSQWRELQAELESSRAAHTAKASEKGKHQSDKDKYDRQLVNRVEFIHNAAAGLEVRGFDGELEDQKIRTFGDRIQKVLADKRHDLEHLRRDNKQEVDKASHAISELDNRKFRLGQDRVNAKREMAKIDKTIASTLEEVNALDVDEGSLALVQNNIAGLDTRLEKARNAEREANLDQKIQEEDSRLRELQVESTRLNHELLECTRLASERAEFDLRKKELTERKRDLDTLTRTWGDKLAAIMGSPMQLGSLEMDFNNLLKRHGASVAGVRSQQESLQQELQTLEYRLSSNRDKQKQVTQQIERCRAAVIQAVKSVKEKNPTMADYPRELDALEVDYKRVETDVHLFDELKKFYQEAQDKLERDNKCTLCSRDFHEQPAAKARFAKRISKRLTDEAKDELLAELAEQEGHLKVLRGVRSEFDTYQRLEQETPVVSKEIQTLEAQKDVLVRRLEDKDNTFREENDKMQDVESVSKTVAKIVRVCKEVADSEKEIERLSSQQSMTGSVHSAEEIRELQVTCGEQVRSITTKLDKYKHDRQHLRDEVVDLDRQKSDLKAKLSDVSYQVQNKQRLQASIQTQKESHAAQRVAIQETDKELEALEPELSKLKSIQQDVRQRGDAKEQKLSKEADSIWNVTSELKRINADIQDYIDRGGPANLAANQRAIATLEVTIANLDKESKELTTQINKLNKEVDSGDRQKKNIRDNISLRKNQREVEALQRKIEELESRNARSDYERLSREANQVDFEASKVNAEAQRIHGQCHAKDASLAELMDEYNNFYKDARAKYREAQIKVETTKAAIEDIGKYSVALEKAVMEYHRLKMAELNRTAGELWQSTYQGTDIDTIMINSDNEGSNSKRTYNYRVCMVKGDTEMDMRGRCSAGQKVLASIIIRLALAESFGLNCGMIALDEPTTNLDSDNIRSLAESLHAIIKNRQQQTNLQLIVITHDEEFLKHMQCSDFCDDFFRVKRDERQNSVIVRESITRVMES